MIGCEFGSLISDGNLIGCRIYRLIIYINFWLSFNRLFSLWQNVVFTDETRVRISSDGIVRVFRRNGTRFLEKKNATN